MLYDISKERARKYQEFQEREKIIRRNVISGLAGIALIFLGYEGLNCFSKISLDNEIRELKAKSAEAIKDYQGPFTYEESRKEAQAINDRINKLYQDGTLNANPRSNDLEKIRRDLKASNLLFDSDL